MNVPAPRTFVSNEVWVHGSENYYPWIEGGQMALVERSPSQLYGFWAWFLSESDYEVEVSTSVGVADEHYRRNLYQFYDREYIGGGHEDVWCAVWETAVMGCAGGIGEPARNLETGVEAATESAPSNNGSSEPYAIGGVGDRWKGNVEAELFTQDGTCGHLDGPKYPGSLIFEAGTECGFYGTDAMVSPAGAEVIPAEESHPTVEPFESYKPGPAVITQEQAQEKALAQAAADGDSSPRVSVSSGTLLGTGESINPAMKAVRASMVGNKGLTAYMDSPVYRVLLTAEGGASFKPALPTPAGAPAPISSHLELVYDMATGWLVRTHGWD